MYGKNGLKEFEKLTLTELSDAKQSAKISDILKDRNNMEDFLEIEKNPILKRVPKLAALKAKEWEARAALSKTRSKPKTHNSVLAKSVGSLAAIGVGGLAVGEVIAAEKEEEKNEKR